MRKSATDLARRRLHEHKPPGTELTPHDELTRGDRIRRAIAAAATELLRSLRPEQSIPKVLELIGAAAEVGRIQLYENEAQPTGRARTALRYEWDAPGIESAAQRMARAGVDAAALDRDQLVSFLAKGDTLGLLARDAKEPFRGVLHVMGVKSILIAPVFVGHQWWGQIGFDDCVHERPWSTTDLDTIKTLAELIGAALGLAHDLAELADASRIIENSPALLYRLSAKPPYSLIYISHNVKRYGYEAADLLASPTRYFELFHPEQRAEAGLDIARILSGKVPELIRELRVRKTDGQYVWVEGRSRPLYDDKHELVAIEGILIDIDQRKTAETERARYLRIDADTGLANRKGFMEQLERAFDTARKGGPAFAIHYIDLDRFKDINDVLGHSKGDELLKKVAERLVALRLSGADLIARFGGDEFAILQSHVSEPSEAGNLAARILSALAEPYDLGTELHITASTGISVFTPEVASPEEMIKQADLALYRAKELGRNQFHFHSEALDAATIERVMLGGDLRRGLTRGELELFYQPQVDLQTRRIVGLEALVRWHHPQHGLLQPKRFIPIAETNGTILVLGQWVIDEVCRQIVEWRKARLLLPTVSVNVSAEQFKSTPAFDRQLEETLRRWNVEPQAIEVELTESVLMETTRQHGEAIEHMHALGIAIAIDDFGTGYSSLGYLRAYRVNHIKIAQEFIKDIQADTGDFAIVRAAISLGRELGIAVIAEGVETESQLKLLEEAGCRLVQGFYFSPPVPAAKAAELLRQETLAPATAATREGAR